MTLTAPAAAPQPLRHQIAVMDNDTWLLFAMWIDSNWMRLRAMPATKTAPAHWTTEQVIDRDFPREQLTMREMQVLAGMAQGKTNGAIARALQLDEETVKSHARKLFDKLGVRDRTQAAVLAHRTGLFVAAE